MNVPAVLDNGQLGATQSALLDSNRVLAAYLTLGPISAVLGKSPGDKKDQQAAAALQCTSGGGGATSAAGGSSSGGGGGASGGGGGGGGGASGLFGSETSSPTVLLLESVFNLRRR